MAFGLGLLGATGHAPLSLWYLAFPALAGALLCLRRARSARHAAWLGWAAGLGYVGGTHFWIVQPFFVDAARHGWMAPFALFFMAGGIALFWAAAYGGAYLLGRAPRARLLALVPAMTLMEIGRAYLFTGFPWAPASMIWLPTPVAQLAALAGPFGLALFTYAVLILPFTFRGRGRLAAAGAVVMALAGAWGWGAGRLAEPPQDGALTVRVVQPNAPQHQKWDPEFITMFFRRQLSLSAGGEGRPDVVIWPETSFAYWLEEDSPAYAHMAAAAQAPLIFGAQRREGARYFNSLAVLSPEGRIAALYDKQHLVPFGEYVPFGDLFARIGIHGLAANEGGGYSAGPGPRVLDLGALGKVLPLICYEASFARDVAGAPERADWIVQITNDAWFGTSAMPYQHLDQSRMRAIEQGLPVVRSANTGISAVVDGRGRILASLPLGEAGALDAPLPAVLPPTAYARLGNTPVFLLLAVLLLAAVGSRGANRIDRGGRNGYRL
ncbi:Apolipoprotein N-acyltransferase [Pseudoruegeria aquimaris]|uniref:Apolipoprotein N-acyltransferase n=1 Tax=Pseudoruegeria aquimaris TaxID=393663 RepID=A0A1Y5TL39_9RHOB|nr:Apolipoprotein N-acyltransferase [Pseudoruegeria aquimaris]